MAAAATTLDRCDAARRKKLPFFGNNAKLREVDRRQTLERVAAQRAALSAARIGLPQVGGGEHGLCGARSWLCCLMW